MAADPPTTRRLPQRVACFLVPALLLLVAGVQMTLVRTHGLTPWKGGGFGMFSTFDSPSSRTLRLVLLTEEGEALVVFPDLDIRRERLLNMPNEGVLTDVARRAAQQDWLLYDYDDLLAVRTGLPAEIRRQLARAEREREADSLASEPYPPLVAFTSVARPAALDGRPAAVQGVRAEVWRLTYDAAGTRLTADLVNSATVGGDADG